MVQSEVGRDFQTIGSRNEVDMTNTGGFFLTEQPIVDRDDRKNIVKIPDLLEENKGEFQLNEPIKVNDMFAFASNQNFEKVYRATTSHVKSLYLKRLKSREKFTETNTPSGAEPVVLSSNKTSVRPIGLKHQRANSMSTTAATMQGGFYRSKNQMKNMAETDTQTVASGLDSSRLRSAMTEVSMQVSKRGSATRHHKNHSVYLRSYNVGDMPRVNESISCT